MSFGSIISQGTFTSDGNGRTLSIRSDIDWIRVVNITGAATPGDAVIYEWYRGMGNGTAIKQLTDGAIEVLTANGFTLVDTSANTIGANNTTITAISAAATPAVSLTDTTDLHDGDVVRIGTVAGAHQLGGIDFTIDNVVANTSFDLIYMVQIVAGTTGNLHKIKYDPIYYPRLRTISDITNAAHAEVTTTVTHNLTVGQKVRFNLSTVNDMMEIDGQIGTVLSVDTSDNTFVVDIDTTGYTPFVFGLTADADAGYTHGHIIPVGETAGGNLDDATRNEGVIGVYLAPGAGTTGATEGGPAGENNDVIYWLAGKTE
jgi:hypothetical protein